MRVLHNDMTHTYLKYFYKNINPTPRNVTKLFIIIQALFL